MQWMHFFFKVVLNLSHGGSIGGAVDLVGLILDILNPCLDLVQILKDYLCCLLDLVDLL